MPVFTLEFKDNEDGSIHTIHKTGKSRVHATKLAMEQLKDILRHGNIEEYSRKVTSKTKRLVTKRQITVYERVEKIDHAAWKRQSKASIERLLERCQ